MRLRRCGDELRVRTPAKTNLFLEILGKRLDGYHELVTVIAAVDLYDELSLTKRGDDRLTFDAVLPACASSAIARGLCGTPADESNLVIKALRRLRKAIGSQAGADVRLVKRIPAAAGLGGGSSDAAASLVAANAAWEVGLSRDALAEIAAEVGSDVPSFLHGDLSICTGRGEKCRTLKRRTTWTAVFARPALDSPTASVYSQLEIPSAPLDAYEFLTARASGDAPLGLFNRLEQAALSLRPELRDVLASLRREGAGRVLLSGSGSCCFGLFNAPRVAGRAASRLRNRRGIWAQVAKIAA